MAHTPEEWFTDLVVHEDRHEDYIGIFDQVDHNDACGYKIGKVDHAYMIATALIDWRDGEKEIEETKRVARLIAVAPKLLTVCKAAESALPSYQYGNSSPELAEEIANGIRAVVAEAEGAK